MSAVMHADEINKAVSEELGKPVYHYHLRIVAIPRIGREMRNPAAPNAQPGFSLCALCGWNKNGGQLYFIAYRNSKVPPRPFSRARL